MGHDLMCKNCPRPLASECIKTMTDRNPALTFLSDQYWGINPDPDDSNSDECDDECDDDEKTPEPVRTDPPSHITDTPSRATWRSTTLPPHPRCLLLWPSAGTLEHPHSLTSPSRCQTPQQLVYKHTNNIFHHIWHTETCVYSFRCYHSTHIFFHSLNRLTSPLEFVLDHHMIEPDMSNF